MEVRVNWKQGKVAKDGLVRVHKIRTHQPSQCKFRAMKDCRDYSSLSSAEAKIKRKGYSMYKRCSHCWDGRVIDPIP